MLEIEYTNQSDLNLDHLNLKLLFNFFSLVNLYVNAESTKFEEVK